MQLVNKYEHIFRAYNIWDQDTGVRMTTLREQAKTSIPQVTRVIRNSITQGRSR